MKKLLLLFLIGTLTAVTSFAQDLTQGLLLNYNFSGNYIDSSINQFDATNDGTVFVEDRFGNTDSAILFDGDDLVLFPSDPSLQPDFPFSFSVWAKVEDFPQFNPFLDFNYTQNNYSGFFATINTGNSSSMSIHYGDSTGATGPGNRRSVKSINSIKKDVWVHLVGIYPSPSVMEIYVNGCFQEVEASGSGDLEIVYTNEPGVLGSIDINTTLPPNFFNGSLDDFYVWDRVITVEEVDLLYNNFHDANLTSIEHQGCLGDGYEVVVDGIVFNESNPAGEIVLQACDGCDSIVNVNLVFAESIEENVFQESCMGSGFEIEVNGTMYNESNPTGSETLSNSFGCDSIISVKIEYFAPSEESIAVTFCEDEDVEVNNVVYSEPGVFNQLIGININGCDSSLVVTVSELSNEMETQTFIISPNQIITINGFDYSQAGTFTQVLPGTNGCNLILTIIITTEVECNQACNIITTISSEFINFSFKDNETLEVRFSGKNKNSVYQMSKEDLIFFMSLLEAESLLGIYDNLFSLIHSRDSFSNYFKSEENQKSQTSRRYQVNSYFENYNVNLSPSEIERLILNLEAKYSEVINQISKGGQYNVQLDRRRLVD
jgi:hypothetical protein